MQSTKKGLLKPGITILVGIILIAFSFVAWYYTISPITSLSKYEYRLQPAAAPKITWLTTNYTNPSIVYFGNIIFNQQPIYNRSRPIDNSFNLFLRVYEITNGPINLTIYVRDTAVFSVQTNLTIQTIIFDSRLYNNASASRPPNSLVFPNVTAPVPSSLVDAFTGGTTPYMIIKNLNTTATTTLSYQYSYSALFRDSDGIPFLLFAVGAIIVVAYGIALVRRFIKQSRGR